MLKHDEYPGVNELDPVKYYYWPIVGRMYRRRVEMCLNQCTGGQRVLEVGFGTGLSFLNLNDMYDEIDGIDLTADCALIQKAFETRGVKSTLRQGSVQALPYPDNHFDTVLLISILEHLQPFDQIQAFTEMRRVLKPGGQVVYGVPIERPFMVFMFRMLGHDIRLEHFSTEKDVASAASGLFKTVLIERLQSFAGAVYEVGHFQKQS